MTCCLSSAARLVSVVGVVLLAVVGAWGSAAATADAITSSPAPPDYWDSASRPDYLDLLPGHHEFGLGAELLDRTAMFPSIQLASPAVDEEWLEGSVATIAYATTGPITKVRLYYYGGKCPLGGRSRGSFGEVIADMAPATGAHRWQVPWIDATSFRLRLAGYSDQDERLAEYERTVRFRPRELADIPPTCLAVIKRKQRLYYYEDGRIARMHIVSTGINPYSTPTMQPGSYSPGRGQMGQVFYKSWAPHSRMYDVVMRYYLAITSSGSHGIHATYPNMYRYLGRPASHGCIRQHHSDANILYALVPVGTPMYVF